MCCRYFLGHVACLNLPWQGLLPWLPFLCFSQQVTCLGPCLLAYWASENKTLPGVLAWKENLLVPDDQTGLFLKPCVSSVRWNASHGSERNRWRWWWWWFVSRVYHDRCFIFSYRKMPGFPLGNLYINWSVKYQIITFTDFMGLCKCIVTDTKSSFETKYIAYNIFQRQNKSPLCIAFLLQNAPVSIIFVIFLAYCCENYLWKYEHWDYWYL